MAQYSPNFTGDSVLSEFVILACPNPFVPTNCFEGEAEKDNSELAPRCKSLDKLRDGHYEWDRDTHCQNSIYINKKFLGMNALVRNH